ncbi:UDP-N-acetylmuramate dehydrogenase [Patescibacteria group bacterium]|nr:UDP-N-acetylmuramate dehydrogenase [Patescibacteria group bacterium]MBU1895382.1 UDP-N-acetylmuramate dehydrogenase [Patescibacteria group bacterium]
MTGLYKKLKEYGKVKANESLAKHTTFRIGGPAQMFVIVESREKMVELLDYLSGEGIEYFIIGGGSNLLLPDEGLDKVVIQTKFNNIKLDGEEIEAEAGALLSQLLDLSAQNSLSGLSWAAGVPGTIGGAVRGNAGAMGFCTADNVKSVEVWHDGEVVHLSKDDCEFGYRDSIFKHNSDIILRVWLKLEKTKKEELAKQIQYNISCRTGQPKGFSAGCFFKNVNLSDWPGDKSNLPKLFLERGTVPVGWLVEQVDMKGKKRGDAQVGVEHGNFILNLDKARAEDIRGLVDEIKQKVYDKYGVEIEEEVQII